MTMRREPVGIYPTLNARAALDLAINVKDYGASGSSSSTTGSMTSGSKTLTLTAAKDFKNGQDISVAGAGASGALLVSSIVSGAGTTTLTLADAAGTTVSAATSRRWRGRAESQLCTVTPCSATGRRLGPPAGYVRARAPARCATHQGPRRHGKDRRRTAGRRR